MNIELATLDLRCRDLNNRDELPDAQRQRASRFATTDLQRRYVAAHVGLRRLLGNRLRIPPHEIRLVTGAFGKPALAPEMRTIDLRFNLTHSADVALVALAAGVEVGVDVERSAPDMREHDITASALSPRERAALASLPEPDRAQAFLRLWVRKEAVLKAVGTGLTVPLSLVDVWSPRADTSGSLTLSWGKSAGTLVGWKDLAPEGMRAAGAVAACGFPQFQLLHMRTRA